MAPLLLALLAAAPADTVLPRAPDALLDGRCEAAEWRGALELARAGGVRLLAQQSERHLGFCVDAPAGSFATLDAYVRLADGGPELQLHVSAKLGERLRGADGSWPAWTWWNNRGWAANPVRWDRCEPGTAERPEPRCHFLPLAGAPEGRELALARSRFGAGPLRVRFEVNGVAGAAGTVRFPAADGAWFTITPS